MRETGVVILGKAVTTEFAATEPRGTRNPWNPARTPGRSNGGSAAAVSCGMVPGAWDASRRLDPAPVQLLQLLQLLQRCRLQAQRRRHQPGGGYHYFS
jgi:hypothetical protein